MSAGSSPLAYRRLRAPREHGSALIDPPPAQLPDLIARNIAGRRADDYDLQGRSIQSLAAAGREDLVRLAHCYTSSYRSVNAPASFDRVFLAGHQPELFHPGVWYKNFALNRLAQDQHAVAVNLVVDSDTVKHGALRVPSGALDEPIVESLSFDSAADEIPYEERELENPGQFAAFGALAAERIRPIVPRPLIEDFWPLVVGRAAVTRNLGECLAQARHQLEGAWGLNTLELPQSQVCTLPAFHWFTAHLLAQLPRFRQIYNDAVADYRRINRVRSANHPVPNLAVDDDWHEAPFWLWSTAAPRRRRLFVRQHASGMTLTDRRRIEFDLPLTPDGDAEAAVEVLSSLGAQGIKLRSRALVTTLFARLVLADLFVHGIGGAKYDQLTDEIIRSFFGREPPGYLVISATLHLAAATNGTTSAEVRDLDQQLRDLEYHPDKHLASLNSWAGAPVDIERWLSLKQQWLGTEQTPSNARQRCHAIRAANEALQAWIEPRRRELLRERQDAQRRARALGVLTSREYAFCLYSAETLRDFLLDFPQTTL